MTVLRCTLNCEAIRLLFGLMLYAATMACLVLKSKAPILKPYTELQPM